MCNLNDWWNCGWNYESIWTNELSRIEFTRVYELIRRFFRWYALTRFTLQIRQCLTSWITFFLATRESRQQNCQQLPTYEKQLINLGLLEVFYEEIELCAKINAIFWLNRRVKGSLREKKTILARRYIKVSRDNVKKYLKEKDWSAPSCVIHDL